MSQKVSDTILKRVYLLFAIFIVFAGMVAVKIMRLQWVEGEKYAEMQKQERVYKKNVLADRGSILADDGTVLATTLPFYRIAMDVTTLSPRNFPNFTDSLQALCEGLATHFGTENQTANDFLQMIQEARRTKDRHIYLFPYNRLLSHNEFKLLCQLPILNQGRFKGGLIVEKENNSRFYPLGNLARITLGYVREDSIPFRGIEYSFQKKLRGKDGQMLVQRVSGGTEVPLNYVYERESFDGFDVRTTLSVNMQDVVDNALRKAVRKHEAKRGIAILMEVKTGKIKAIANFPETYNHAVATQLEPGSTFKMASALALLEGGFVQPGDSINVGQGKVEYDDRTMRDDYTSGKITFQTAVEKSSNIAISKLVNDNYRANPRKFYDQLDAMGLLKPLNFQLKGEPNPYIVRPGTKHFNNTTLPWLSIGYNVLLTPLQILAFYNALANDGVYIQPLLVQSIEDHGNLVARYEAQVLNKRLCSRKTLAQLHSMMEGVVLRGSARRIKDGNVPIAGKTSTTQKLKFGKYMASYTSSFAGYFPADNPKYSCIVVIDEPAKEFYGGAVAAPVVREIADHLQSTRLRDMPVPRRAPKQKYPQAKAVHSRDAQTFYQHLDIPYQAPANEVSYIRATANSKEVLLKPHRTALDRVPDTRGMTAKDALPLLENLGLQVALRGHGRVTRQSIPPGKRILRNEPIILDLK